MKTKAQTFVPSQSLNTLTICYNNLEKLPADSDKHKALDKALLAFEKNGVTVESDPLARIAVTIHTHYTNLPKNASNHKTSKNDVQAVPVDIQRKPSCKP